MVLLMVALYCVLPPVAETTSQKRPFSGLSLGDSWCYKSRASQSLDHVKTSGWRGELPGFAASATPAQGEGGFPSYTQSKLPLAVVNRRVTVMCIKCVSFFGL